MNVRVTPRYWLYVLDIVIAAAGLAFVLGGVRLISLGGSWYFLVARLTILASGIQIFRGRRSGGWLFLLAFFAPIAWAFWEVGFDYWGLISRLLAMTVGAAVVAFSLPDRKSVVSGQSVSVRVVVGWGR